MTTIKQHMEKLKGKKVILVFQRAKKTQRTDDGSSMRIDADSVEGTLQEVFDDGWLLVNECMFHMSFIRQVLEASH